jgi:reverse gyrase
VRRAEDRIVGFKVSNVLKDELSDANNGSGRVQGPVLKWIAKRYEDYVRNKGYVGLVSLGDVRFRVFLGKEKKERLRIIVRKLDETTTVISPKPPFTTDQLLEEASKTFGWSPSQIMRLAQDLFETGLITYHRTDSSHVSSYGIEIARNYLASNDLLSEFQPRQWGGPGTHEAIRPTSPVDAKTISEQVLVNPVFNRLTTAHLKLYDLIFRRFIASQMRPATARIAKYEVEFDGLERRVVEIVTEAKGGFVSVYPLKTGRLEEGEFEVPVRVSLGSAVQLLDYPEVVRLMKEYSIGRPSTYARTIQAIMRHGYVIESKRAKKLIITKKGMRAYRVLESKFPELLEESTTARLLDALDKVAQGVVNPEDLIRSSVASYFESVLPNDSYEYV